MFFSRASIIGGESGANFISPFVGRLDDVGFEGMNLIKEICEIYAQHPEYDTQVLAASIRHPLHVTQAAKCGADIATIPPKIIHQLLQHPLTDKGLDTFVKDWQKTGQKILP